jgi:hypothetical protein
MTNPSWQKSSYCGEGESCIHVATAQESIRMTESSDPAGAILTAAPSAFAALARSVKQGLHD